VTQTPVNPPAAAAAAVLLLPAMSFKEGVVCDASSASPAPVGVVPSSASGGVTLPNGGAERGQQRWKTNSHRHAVILLAASGCHAAWWAETYMRGCCHGRRCRCYCWPHHLLPASVNQVLTWHCHHPAAAAAAIGCAAAAAGKAGLCCPLRRVLLMDQWQWLKHTAAAAAAAGEPGAALLLLLLPPAPRCPCA